MVQNVQLTSKICRDLLLNVTKTHTLLYKSVFGDQYNDLYKITLEAPVFDLFGYKGGLRPSSGRIVNSSNTLNLELSDGKQYVIKALKKEENK